MKHLIFFAMIFFVGLNCTAAVDDDDEESYESYTEILNRLSKPKAVTSSKTSIDTESRISRLGDTIFHAGVGFIGMYQIIEINKSTHREYLQNTGFQASFGIDLLSPVLLAEGTVRSFESNNLSWTKFSLKEFDLKFAYKPRLVEQLGLKMGAGISARYSVYRRPSGEEFYYTTPASVLFGGFDIFVSEMISFGIESSYRSALVGQTADQSAADATFRIDGHF